MRKFVAPALELIMLDKALNGKFDIEEARLLFGEMYATAVAGDGTVEAQSVMLAVGGELGGGAALLRLAALLSLNQLLSDEWKFGVRTYVVRDRYYYIATHGENATKLKRFLAVTVPSAGGEYLSEKFNEFMKETRVEVRVDENSMRRTEKGHVAADLTLSEAGVAVKYNIYLRDNAIELQLRSSDRGRVELAARLLRLAGVTVEVKKEGGTDRWYVYAATDMLAAGREELRDAIAKIVGEAAARGWVDASRAELWLEKLGKGRVLKEGWPKYEVRLAKGAFRVRFSSTSPDSIVREAQRLRDMGFEEGRHFSVKMPEEDRYGYVSILREGLAYAAWLSVYGKDEQQRKLAAEFVEYILQRAKEEGDDVYRKAEEIVKEGKARGILKLEGFEGVVEVGGSEHVVKVIDGGAEVEEGEGGRKLLRIKITAEVDRVLRDYTITYSRRRAGNAAVGYAYARADREADAERFSAVIKALTGEEPKVYRMKDGKIKIECYEGHLEGFMRYTELADVIARWLEETGRR